MANFRSFQICNDFSPQPEVVQTTEDHPVSISVNWIAINLWSQPISIIKEAASVTSYNRERGLFLGTVSGTTPTLVYTPQPHAYGTDQLYYTYGFCPALGPFDSRVIIAIQPSAARQRPTLLISNTKTPSLLGLNGHRYRIEQSADLNSWEPIGSATGNYTTVDLSPFISAGTRAQFLRASEITGP